MIELPAIRPNPAKPMPHSAPNSPHPAPSLLSMPKPDHPLLKLAVAIDWDSLNSEFTPCEPEMGRPPLPTPLMVGLHYLKSMYDVR